MRVCAPLLLVGGCAVLSTGSDALPTFAAEVRSLPDVRQPIQVVAKPGEELRLTLRIENHARTELTLLKATADCGCLVPEFAKSVIAPNHQYRLDVRVRVGTVARRSRKQLRLSFEESPLQTYVVPIDISVDTPISIPNNSVSFAPGQLEGIIAAKIADPTVKILGCRSLRGCLEIGKGIRPITDGVQIPVVRKFDTGTCIEVLRFRCTQGEVEQDIDVQLAVNSLDRVRFLPDRLTLGGNDTSLRGTTRLIAMRPIKPAIGVGDLSIIDGQGHRVDPKSVRLSLQVKSNRLSVVQCVAAASVRDRRDLRLSVRLPGTEESYTCPVLFMEDEK